MPWIKRDPLKADAVKNSAEDVHHAREIVGAHVERYLGCHLGQAFYQKVDGPHPHLERAEGMLGRFTTPITSSARRSMSAMCGQSPAQNQVWNR
jgi:hypothetical protein